MKPFLLSISTAMSLFSGLVLATSEMRFPATPEDLKGMASLICSGVVIRTNRLPDQHAVVLTNGHCATTDRLDPDQTVVGVPYTRSEISIFSGGETAEKVQPRALLYATMNQTDLALIEIEPTYRELESHGAKIYEIESNPSPITANVPVVLISGFWKEKLLCTISHTVDQLVEAEWSTRGALALADPCPTEGGWSGTPLLHPESGKILGLLHTSNREGALCTLDNPCEVGTGGTRMAFHGRSYAVRTNSIPHCWGLNGQLDLTRTGCELPKPAAPTIKR